MFATIEELKEYCELCPTAPYHGADNCYSIECPVLAEYDQLMKECPDGIEEE